MATRIIISLFLISLVAGCSSSRTRALAERAAQEAAKKAEEEARRQLQGLGSAGGPLGAAALSGFAPGKATLKPAYFRSWFERHRNTLFSTIQGLPEGSVLAVVGHSDPQGGEALADSLGRQRADYVARELMRLGVPAHKLSTSSVGSQQMANTHFPGAGENRRVTFQVSAGTGGIAGALRSALPSGLPGTQSFAPDVTALNAELEKLALSGFTSARSSLTRSYEAMWLSRLQPLLPQIRAALAGGYRLEVAGHSDPFGGYQKAERFGRQRANYVAGLLRKNGIPSRSMQVVSKAANELANPNFVGAAENRRVTLRLLPGYGAAPSGLPGLQGLQQSLPSAVPTGLPFPGGSGSTAIPDYPAYTGPGY